MCEGGGYKQRWRESKGISVHLWCVQVSKPSQAGEKLLCLLLAKLLQSLQALQLCAPSAGRERGQSKAPIKRWFILSDSLLLFLMLEADAIVLTYRAPPQTDLPSSLR